MYANPPTPGSRSEFLLAWRVRLIKEGQCTEANADDYLAALIKEQRMDVVPEELLWILGSALPQYLDGRPVLVLHNPTMILFDPTPEELAWKKEVLDKWMADNYRYSPIHRATPLNWSAPATNVTVTYTPPSGTYRP